MSIDNCKVIKREDLQNSEAHFSRLVKATYHDAHSVIRAWEYVERSTRNAPKIHGGDGIDGVGIIAILEKPSGPEIVLIKQFRPPIDLICVETPGGLLDRGESAEETAVRELREETGYVGVADERGPVMWNDPGLANTNSRMVRVKVDMSLPENKDPKAKTEMDEFIEVFTLPLKNMWAGVKALEAEGYAIDKAVVMVANGVELARLWGV